MRRFYLHPKRKIILWSKMPRKTINLIKMGKNTRQERILTRTQEGSKYKRKKLRGRTCACTRTELLSSLCVCSLFRLFFLCVCVFSCFRFLPQRQARCTYASLSARGPASPVPGSFQRQQILIKTVFLRALGLFFWNSQETAQILGF